LLQLVAQCTEFVHTGFNHGVLLSVSQAFDLPGELPPFEPMHMLMANLLGSIVCVWAVLRIRDPQQVFGRYDAVGRFLFSAWQLYALVHGASSLLVIFLVFELAWGVAQVLPVRQPSRASRIAAPLAPTGPVPISPIAQNL
jgi:magnesium-transporting ATPase (P-type)